MPCDHHHHQPVDWASNVADSLSSDEGGPTDEESTSNNNTNNGGTSGNRQRSMRRKRLRFSSELTPEELVSIHAWIKMVYYYIQAQWPLKMGRNDLVFSITTKYQVIMMMIIIIVIYCCHCRALLKLIVRFIYGTILLN